MKEEGLDEEEPEGHGKHEPNRNPKKRFRARVTEGGESGKGEDGKVSKRAKRCERHGPNVRVCASKDLETIGRSAAKQRFARERLHSQVNGFSKSDQGEKRSQREENDASTRHRRDISRFGLFFWGHLLLRLRSERGIDGSANSAGV